MNPRFRQTPPNRFPVWLFIGAAALLLPVFAFLTVSQINRQKENTVRLMREKGAALIRSFEAGTRTGMMGMSWSPRHLYRLLEETSRQPDISYLMVTDANGHILAQNDPRKIKNIHGNELELKNIGDKIQWREIINNNGNKIFEVYRRFEPTVEHFGKRHSRRMLSECLMGRGMMGRRQPVAELAQPFVIFVGLNMEPVEEARRLDTRHTIMMSSILLLVAFSGIFVLLISQRYRATRTTLTRIRAFSDTLVENLPIALLALDAKKRIVSFNPVASRIFPGLTDDAVGKKAEDTLPARFMDTVNRLGHNREVLETELVVSVGNKKKIPLETGATVLFDDQKNFLGYVVLFKDLTEVRELRKEIERSRRLASVGSMAAGVAHEIRNPLSSVKGFATYFKERYKENPDDREIADILIHEVERLDRVIGQLLDLSRPVKITPEPTDLKSFVDESLRLVQQKIEKKNIEIKLDFDLEKSTYAIDRDKLTQALLNLYLNAVEAMEENGVLGVNVSGKNGDNGLEIAVSDTGSGIGEKDLMRIFDPYYTTKSSGTGLGLAIVHNIMEAHGGEIRLESEPDAGTTIRLIFPSKT